MAWLIGLVVALLVAVLAFLALPAKDWRAIADWLRGIFLRARRRSARREEKEGRPSPPEEPAPPRASQEARPRRPSPARPAQAPPAPPRREPPEREWSGEEGASPTQEERRSYQERKGRPAMEKILRATSPKPEPQAGEAPHRRPVSEVRRSLLLAFIVILLVGLILTIIPRFQRPAPPPTRYRPHHLRVVVARLDQDVGLHPIAPLGGAVAAGRLASRIREFMSQDGMTDTVTVEVIPQAPVVNTAAYELAQSEEADLLLWGRLVEGETSGYLLTLTVIPRPDQQVPEFDEYLQVMATPPHFRVNGADQRSVAVEDLGQAMAWLGHFYLGEFEVLESRPPDEEWLPTVSPAMLDFHWAAMLWLQGEYGPSQQLYASVAGQESAAQIGPTIMETVPITGPEYVILIQPEITETAPITVYTTVVMPPAAEEIAPCPSEMDPSLCAAAKNNQAVALLTDEALGQVPTWPLDRPVDLLTQAAQADPASPIVQYNLGRAYLARRQWSQAVEVLKGLVQRDSLGGRALAALSEAYRGYGDAGQAEWAARQAIAVDGTLAEGHLALGRYFLGMGQLREADQALSQALSLAEDESRRRRSAHLAASEQPQPKPIETAYMQAWAQRNNPLLSQIRLAQANRLLIVGIQEGPADFFTYLWQLISGTRGSLDLAQDELTLAVEIHQNWYEAFCLQGEIWLARGDYHNALREFERAVQRDRRAVEAYLGQARVYEAQARASRQAGDPEKEGEARANLAALYHLLADQGIAPALGHFRLGEMARQERRWEDAYNEYLFALQDDPAYAEAYLRLGQVELELGDDEAALDHFGLAIEHAGPQRWIYAAGHVERGQVLLERYIQAKNEGWTQPELLAEARREFESARKDDSGRRTFRWYMGGGVVLPIDLPGKEYGVRALNGLARVSYEEENLAEAERLFHDVLRQDGRNFGALYGLGLVYIAQGRSEEAAEKLRAANEVYPWSIAAHHYLGKAYYALLREEEASREYGEANRLCQEQRGWVRRSADDREICP